MGRPRKAPRPEMDETSDFSEENENFLPGEPESSPQDLVVARQRHRIVTEYEKAVPVEELEVRPQDLVVEGEPATSQPEASGTLPEEVAALLQEAGSNANRYQLKVWRLPRYAEDGRTDTMSRNFCGVIDFTTDYESLIQSRWGQRGGYFKVDIIRNGKMLTGGSLAPFFVEPLSREEQQSTQPISYVFEQESAPQPTPQPLKAQLKELAELKTLMDTIFPRPVQQANPPAQASDPEAAFLSILARDTDVVDRLAKGTLGKLLGESPRDENPWADVVMEAIKTGQAANLLQTAINSIFNGLRSMTPQPQPVVVPPVASTTEPESLPPAAAPSPAAAPVSPEDRVLAIAIHHCLARIPVQVAATRILAIADQINEQAPEYSVDGYLRLFVTMTPLQAIEFAATASPEGARLREVEHATAWVTELQQAIAAQLDQGGEDEDQ